MINTEKFQNSAMADVLAILERQGGGLLFIDTQKYVRLAIGARLLCRRRRLVATAIAGTYRLPTKSEAQCAA